ncbi:monofunctional biosynthetic peptidoglycan transglycosylase [Ectothiorhodospira magna]|uniref:Biosynthetic peptidoglycan transglycosylase n=1 Tax=Ectothiorhodospira magna TaxID=867345 RepID=A0A1H9BQ32_9GAMM|nr:monofunctional biosynthetic peptidoglycan transglycosylase [Ectothiorhodospira magna]
MRWLLALLAVLVLISALIVGSLRWIDPPTTSFMLQHQWSSRPAIGTIPVNHEWVPRQGISPQAALAVIAAEDQRFLEHRGFDFLSIRAAIDEYRDGGRLRGASTLSQQVAKNVFLWPDRSLSRKIIEAYLTILIEALWPKERILEVYLNVAQFGPNVYGVGAASRIYFDKPAAELTGAEAALLAAVLPGPVRYRVAAPSDYVRARQAWIERQMNTLGGTGFLQAFWDTDPEPVTP